jgi:hypothetical protein
MVYTLPDLSASLNNNLAVPAVISPVKINAIAKYTAGILPLSGLAWYNTRGKPIIR